MSNIDKLKATFDMLPQSDKAIVANYIDMRNKYPGFEDAFDVWESRNGGYNIEEFFEFLDSYEANGTPCGFSGQPILS